MEVLTTLYTIHQFLAREWQVLPPKWQGMPDVLGTTYRLNSKVSLNPNFCVGCFELIISKNFAAASKMGKNGQKKIFGDFFLQKPIFA